MTSCLRRVLLLPPFLTGGCFVIPVYPHYEGAPMRENVEKALASSDQVAKGGPLKSGETTREEVLLRLGDPDQTSQGGRRFVCRWSKAVAAAGIAMPPFGGGSIMKTHVRVLPFDEGGVRTGTEGP